MIINTEVDFLRLWYREEKRYQDCPRKAWKEAWSKLRFARNLDARVQAKRRESLAIRNVT